VFPDPIIDEIREVRHRVSEQCGHDPKRLVEYYIQLQEEYKDRLLETPKPESSSEAK